MNLIHDYYFNKALFKKLLNLICSGVLLSSLLDSVGVYIDAVALGWVAVGS